MTSVLSVPVGTALLYGQESPTMTAALNISSSSFLNSVIIYFAYVIYTLYVATIDCTFCFYIKNIKIRKRKKKIIKIINNLLSLLLLKFMHQFVMNAFIGFFIKSLSIFTHNFINLIFKLLIDLSFFLLSYLQYTP